MSSIPSTSSAAASQQAILLLQAQMAQFSSAANGSNTRARADYKTLQSDIQSGNVSAAQTDLSRLQKDSKASATVATNPASAPSPTQAPVDNHGDLDRSEAPAKFTLPGTINKTA